MLSLSSDAKYLDDDSEEGIGPLLSSRHAVEQLDGMKRLIALMSIGRDVSRFFPGVVNLIASDSFGVKKLAYIYMVRYAESCPDEALLSINSFQKDLADPNPVVRTLSLRVMSSVRVPVTVPLVVMAIQKCSRDPSPVVRTAAALAIPKVLLCNDRDQGQLLEEAVGTLLQDSSPSVLGCAALAFLDLCPGRMDLLHAHFFKLCGILPELNEWGQSSVLRLLLMYGRGHLQPPPGLGPVFKGGHGAVPVAAGVAAREVGGSGDGTALAELERDRQLLVRSAAPLLRSRNSGVVVAAASILLHLGEEGRDGQAAAASMVHLLRSSPKGCGQVLLANIAAVSEDHPGLFRSAIAAFYVTEADRADVRGLKVRILASLADGSTIKGLLREFQAYIRQGDRELVCQTVRALGRCAVAVPQIAEPCVKTLLSLAFHSSDAVSAESVSMMRALMQHQPGLHARSLAKLLRRLPELRSPQARATAVWMAGMDLQVAAGSAPARGPGGVAIGGVHDLDDSCLAVLRQLSPEVIRMMAGTFHTEEEVTKLQVLGTSAKLMLMFPERMGLLHAHVLQLGLLDPAYDVRDKARLLQGLGPPLPEGAGEGTEGPEAAGGGVSPGDSVAEGSLPLHTLSWDVLLCPKSQQQVAPAAVASSPPRWAMGSLSLAVGHAVPGYSPIPDFPSGLPDPGVRRAAGAPPADLPVAIPAPVSAASLSPPPAVTAGIQDLQLVDSGFYSDDDESGGSSGSESSSGSEGSSDDEGERP